MFLNFSKPHPLKVSILNPFNLPPPFLQAHDPRRRIWRCHCGRQLHRRNLGKPGPSEIHSHRWKKSQFKPPWISTFGQAITTNLDLTMTLSMSLCPNRAHNASPSGYNARTSSSTDCLTNCFLNKMPPVKPVFQQLEAVSGSRTYSTVWAWAVSCPVLYWPDRSLSRLCPFWWGQRTMLDFSKPTSPNVRSNTFSPYIAYCWFHTDAVKDQDAENELKLAMTGVAKQSSLSNNFGFILSYGASSQAPGSLQSANRQAENAGPPSAQSPAPSRPRSC